MSYYLGVDVGGTNLAVGVVDEENKIIARANAKCPVPCPEETFCDILAGVVREALANANITLNDIPWIGLGCPGTVNRDTGVIEFANNLGYSNFPLRDMLLRASRRQGSYPGKRRQCGCLRRIQSRFPARRPQRRSHYAGYGYRQRHYHRRQNLCRAPTSPRAKWAIPSLSITAIPATAAARAAGKSMLPQPH